MKILLLWMALSLGWTASAIDVYVEFVHGAVGGVGDVVGPATSTQYSPALYTDTTGKTLISPPYSFPIVDGALNEVLVTNGLGVVEWTGIQTPQLGEIDWIDFIPQTPAPSYNEGRLFYDKKSSSLSFYNDVADMTLNVGEELISEVRNATGATILNGSPVKIVGSVGQVISVALSDLAGDSSVYGVATHDILNNTNGYVTTEGVVNNVDLSSFLEGDFLYLTTTPGEYTNIQPIPPNRIVVTGIVNSNHPVTGSMQVRPYTLFGNIFNNDGIVTPGNFASFSELTGRLITDSGISINDIAALQASSTDYELRISANEASITTNISEIADRVEWMGNWLPNEFHKNQMTKDGEWTMIANKTTTDPPAPQENGEPAFLYPDTPAWFTQGTVGKIESGMTMTMNEGGWLKSIRVWVPEITADTHYTLYWRNITAATTQFIDNLENIVTAGEWSTVFLETAILPKDAVIEIALVSQNYGSTTNISGGWLYTGTDQNTLTCPGNWNINGQDSVLRICKEDLDTTDRSSELAGIIDGSTANMVQTNNTSKNNVFGVDVSGVDQGLYYEYIIHQISEQNSGVDDSEITTVDIEVPVPQNTNYVYLNNQWPTNNPIYAVIDGFLEIDDVPQIVNSTGFGLDVEFQRATISPDWDVVAYSTLSTSGGGSSGGGGGDFYGPDGAVTDNIITFDNITGKLGKDSGVAISAISTKLDIATNGTGALGQSLIAQGDGTQQWITKSDGDGDVVGPASAVVNSFAFFDDTTGKLISDNGGRATYIPGDVAQYNFLADVTGVGGDWAGVRITTEKDGDQKTEIRLYSDTSTPVVSLIAQNNWAGVVLGDGEAIPQPKIILNGLGGQIIIQPPNPMTGQYFLTLPPAGPLVANQVLESDASGTLSWIDTPTGVGDVVGPTSATNNSIAKFDGTTGKLIQSSRVIIDDNEDIILGNSDFIRFPHPNESNNDDGKIGSGIHAEGLNIVGSQTIGGNGRKVKIWGVTNIDSRNVVVGNTVRNTQYRLIGCKGYAAGGKDTGGGDGCSGWGNLTRTGVGRYTAYYSGFTTNPVCVVTGSSTTIDRSCDFYSNPSTTQVQVKCWEDATGTAQRDMDYHILCWGI